jgi:hypothetical protein
VNTRGKRSRSRQNLPTTVTALSTNATFSQYPQVKKVHYIKIKSSTHSARALSFFATQAQIIHHSNVQSAPKTTTMRADSSDVTPGIQLRKRKILRGG